MHQLTLFGTAGLATADGPVVGRAAQGRRLALLAYLAFAHGRPVSRDRLVALLWPESTADRARAQLSDDLYIIRSALGDEVVRSVGDEIALSPHLMRSDVADFERLIAEGSPESAEVLVTGPLLDGFHVNDSAEFEHWLGAERARLGRMHAKALEALAMSSEAAGQFVPAVAWWQRLAALDPYSGRVALRLMKALVLAGDRAGALRHARVHAALLQNEFAAEPDAEVEALAEQLRAEPTRTGAPVLSDPAVVILAATAPAVVVPKVTATDEADSVAPVAPLTPPATPDSDAKPAGANSSLSSGPAWRPRALLAATFATSCIVILLFVLIGMGGAKRKRTVAAASSSVGVLPFVNMGRDPADAYLGDGLAEQVIASLSRTPGLRVAARTSSFALRGGVLDARIIGDTLNVATVLEGSVRREGERLRVAAQLIDAKTGYNLWSAEYDREVVDVLALQEEIAAAITAALELRLPVRARPSQGKHLPDPKAYDLYLRALHLRDEMTAHATQSALELLDLAIDIDPRFALAWAEKANVLGPRIYYRHVAQEQGIAELRTAVARALALDPELGEARVASGMLRLFFDWDWEGAERDLRRAVELNPSDPHAWHHLGNHLIVVGRFDDALLAREQSIALDPLNARMRIAYATDLHTAGRLDLAADQYERVRQLDPMLPHALGLGSAPPVGAMIHAARGRDEDAVEDLVRVAALRGATSQDAEVLRAALRASGMRGVWQRWLELDMRQTANATNPMRMAMLCAYLGETEKAIDWLERAHVERNPGIVFIRREHVLASLRTNARYQRITEAMRFPLP